MAGSRRRPHGNGVVAVSEGELDPRHFLGRLATYTLPDEERNGAKLVRAWAKHGLDVDDLPDARQPVHVFQSACASVNTRRASNGHGERIEVRADEVNHNAAVCTYQITVKVWDLANRVIEHEKAMRLTFDKRASKVECEDLGYKDVRLREIEERIRKNFDANAKTVPGQKIRNAVRDSLLKVGAQNLRRKAGGLYFVPAEYLVRPANGTPAVQEQTHPLLRGLAGVLEELYGERADFYTIPLVNDEGQQAMVRKHFVINANDRARELAEKAINRVRAGKGQRGVRQDLLTNMWNERRKLAGAVAQFEDLVAVEQEDLAANLRDLDNALQKLQELADE